LTATGLFPKHFQKLQRDLERRGTETIFFQNELPYDAPEPGGVAA
jgi:hypothetical protein